jgi:hypothetical protein
MKLNVLYLIIVLLVIVVAAGTLPVVSAPTEVFALPRASYPT